MDSAARASAPESTGTTSANGNGRRGLIDLARVAVEDTVRLVQQEIQLAKIEIGEMLRSNLRAAIFLSRLIILGLLGKSMLKIGPPPKTMTTLKEDAEWAKQVLKRNGK